MLKKPSIFGIGLGKTGSNSLRDALEILGFDAVHTGKDAAAGKPAVKERLLHNMKTQAEDPLDGVGGMDALIDYPVHKMWKEIYHAYPDAKYILTYRPPDDCALSWCRMVSLQHYKVVALDKSYTGYVERFRKHLNDVFNEFYGRPESLLVLDTRIDNESKWLLLKEFLGVDQDVNVPYPHSFDHREWEIEERRLP